MRATEPGGVDVRYMLTVEEMEEFVWALVGCHEPSIPSYIRIIDRAFGKFIGLASKGRVHPSAILSDLVQSKTFLFDPANGRDDLDTDDSDAASRASTNSVASVIGEGVCFAWAMKGVCTSGKCSARQHPNALKGAGSRQRNANKRATPDKNKKVGFSGTKTD